MVTQITQTKVKICMGGKLQNFQFQHLPDHWHQSTQICACFDFPCVVHDLDCDSGHCHPLCGPIHHRCKCWSWSQHFLPSHRGINFEGTIT